MERVSRISPICNLKYISDPSRQSITDIHFDIANSIAAEKVLSSAPAF